MFHSKQKISFCLFIVLILVLHTISFGQDSNSLSKSDQKKVVIQEEKNGEMPLDFDLHQNYPNPFNPSTTIQFSLPEPGNVALKIFNILGGEIETIVQDKFEAGNIKVTYTPRNLPSGVYFYRLEVITNVDSEQRQYFKTKRFIYQK